MNEATKKKAMHVGTHAWVRDKVAISVPYGLNIGRYRTVYGCAVQARPEEHTLAIYRVPLSRKGTHQHHNMIAHTSVPPSLTSGQLCWQLMLGRLKTTTSR